MCRIYPKRVASRSAVVFKGRVWSHNDSGEPVLYGLDERGKVTARLRLTGAKVEDWEAVAVGPCPSGSCLFVADIGDNDAARKQITVYRVPEPAGNAETVNVTDVFHATYPDGPHDAETLLVAPGRRPFHRDERGHRSGCNVPISARTEGGYNGAAREDRQTAEFGEVERRAHYRRNPVAGWYLDAASYKVPNFVLSHCRCSSPATGGRSAVSI